MGELVSSSALLAGLIGVLLFGVVPALGKILDELKAIRGLLSEINYRGKKREEAPDPYEGM